MPLITVKNLVRYYDNHCAVDDISFTLKTGDILGFLGPNGAGKTTTMQMLSGNLAPNEGEIHINGFDLLDNPKRAKAEIGYLPEQPPLYKEMTVDEYLTYCAKLHRIEKNRISNAMKLAKTRCGLMESGHRLIGNLSKGYQQRVGIAQAIIHSPKIIILDEPTVGLDPNQIREIRDLIIELGKEHGIILCTHILPEVEAVCNRIQIINHGKLVYEADMDVLLGKRLSGLYELSLLQPPNIDALSEIPEINNVERLNDNTFLLQTNALSAENIASIVIENNWGLQKIQPHERVLEQIFIDLTHSENNNEAKP
ncbi:MAG: ATP-binding cassette domain-containing protein [Gammaproteobacteria bacterium]|nr:ATP-binding cassette domain-containing protein [Gammaproteobacteria bacterium]